MKTGIVAASAVGGAAAFMAWAVRGRAASVLCESYHRGPIYDQRIALTFDDGPSPATEELAALLDDYNVKATFFECGAHVERHPEITRRLVMAGHEIGNHTWSHPRLSLKPKPFILDEILRTQQLLTDVAGHSPRWFRAPYGVKWFGLRDVLSRFGMANVMWTCIARDWVLDANAISRRVLSAVSNGGIICLHDGRGLETQPDVSSTLSAVRYMLPILLDRGYKCVTVSELLCSQN